MSNVLEVKKPKLIADKMMDNFIDLNKIIEGSPGVVKQEFEMSRQQFRQMKRDQQRTSDVIKSFNTKQKETVHMMLKANENYYVDKMSQYAVAIHSSVNATLGEMVEGFTKEAAGQFWDEVNELAMEHLEKCENKIITKREMEEMTKEVKEFVFEALNKGEEAGTTKKEMKFKFPKLTGAQVKNAYAEAKEEWEAVNKIVDVIEEPVKKARVKKSKKEAVTITKEAGEQLEKIVEDLKEEGKAVEINVPKVSDGMEKAATNLGKSLRNCADKIADAFQDKITIEEVAPEQAENELEEIKAEEGWIVPVAIPTQSITEQLKGKLELFEAKKEAIGNDIKACEEKIKELQEAINNKHKSISEVEVKVKNVEQMIQLAKGIE